MVTIKDFSLIQSNVYRAAFTIINYMSNKYYFLKNLKLF